MRRALLVPTVRPAMMHALADSLVFLPRDWRIYIGLQCYSDDEQSALLNHPQIAARLAGSMTSSQRTPPYLARAHILRLAIDKVDIWANLDDDMVILPTVDYDAMMVKALEPGVGIVSGNWARSAGLLKRHPPVKIMVRQPLVNMAGGMIYTRAVAQAIISADVMAYHFCDVQAALVAYLAGYDNYRYRGSVILHKIMAPGGLKQSYAEQDFILPDPHWLRVLPSTVTYPGRDTNYHMPDSSLLTPSAHERHARNRAALGFA